MKRLLLIIWLLVASVITIYALTDKQVIIVVHTGESKTLLYNPATHEVVSNETADGNVILTVQPKKDQ